MTGKLLTKLDCINQAKKENCHFLHSLIVVAVVLGLFSEGFISIAKSTPIEGTENFQSFDEWCLNQDTVSAGAKHTIDVLLQKIGTSDCNEANRLLSNLTKLDLNQNQISDLRPLSSLINLTQLSLSFNKIGNISPLSSLTNLTHLSLETNEFSNLKPLSSLTNLIYLHLGGNGDSTNKISDISPLSSLTNLTYLDLSANSISDISPLSSLTNLTHLNLWANKISGISPLSSLTNLTELYLANNPIRNIKPLSSLTNLTDLVLLNNKISDISPLSSLTNLTDLALSGNKISDISPLSSLTNLTDLALSRNEITDIRPLSNLPNLRFIELSSNPIIEKKCPVKPAASCYFDDDASNIYEWAKQQYQQGQFQLASETLQAALTIYQKAGDRKREANVLNLLGNTYFYLGQYARSLEFYQQALAIGEKIGDRAGEIIGLTGFGTTYARLGQYEKALKILEPIGLELESRIKSVASDPPPIVSRPSSRISGAVESSIFLPIRAAFSTGETDFNTPDYGTLFTTLASVYGKRGKYSEALKFARLGLAVGRNISEIHYVDPNGEAYSLDAVGVAYLQVGNPKRALVFLEKALERMRELENRTGEGRVLNHIGELYFNQGNKQKALEFYQQALPLRQQANDIAGQGETLNNLGLLYFNQGQYTEAEKYLFNAIKVLEALRSGLKDDEKIAIFETQTVTYRLLQKVLIAQNKYNEALEISDRARARAFVELLAQRFNGAEEQQITPLTLEQIQRIAKEQNATLVEYSLVYNEFNLNGKQQPEESELYIWVIQPTGEITFRRTDLKSLWQQQNTSLDKIVGEARCFENDACRQTLISSRGVGNIPEIRRSLVPIQFNNALAQTIAASQETQQNRQLQQLHQLLIEPIADLLPKDPNNRVIFIPQSSLFLAPFPALQDKNGTYLIEKHTILTAPSIQVLDLTRQQRQKLSPSIKEALIVGNPTMPKISPNFGEPPLQLSSLPGAETEAQEIAKLLNTTPLIGNQATKSAIVQKMPQSRIIHLATHGSFDSERGIGSWIALAPDSPSSRNAPTALGKTGHGIGDGLLKAEEIVDLNLNAELVVLSACDTAQGKITGDGVVGLSRSLISAGTPSVLVSLWKVDDNATAFLMREFYQNWQSGPDKAQALRQAMLTTKQKYPNPRFWAAFTLIGEAE